MAHSYWRTKPISEKNSRHRNKKIGVYKKCATSDVPQIVTAMAKKNPTNNFYEESFPGVDEREEMFFPPRTEKDRIAATEGFKINGIPQAIFYHPQTDEDMKNLFASERKGKRKQAAPIPDFEGRLKAPAPPKVSPFKTKLSSLTDEWQDTDFVTDKNAALADRMREIQTLILREEAGIRKDFPSLRHKHDKFMRIYFPVVISAVETFPEVLEHYSPESMSKYLPHVNMKMAVFIHRLARHKGNDLPKLVPEVNLKDKIYRFCVKEGQDSDD